MTPSIPTTSDAEVQAVADALKGAELEFRMELIRLVDGVSTYRLSMEGHEAREFESTDECYAAIAAAKAELQARAVIAALRLHSSGEYRRGFEECRAAGLAAITQASERPQNTSSVDRVTGHRHGIDRALAAIRALAAPSAGETR